MWYMTINQVDFVRSYLWYAFSHVYSRVMDFEYIYRYVVKTCYPLESNTPLFVSPQVVGHLHSTSWNQLLIHRFVIGHKRHWSESYLGRLLKNTDLLNKHWLESVEKYLTHLSLDKIATISQMIFPDAFSWMKSFVFWLKFPLSLFLRIQLTITQLWLR